MSIISDERAEELLEFEAKAADTIASLTEEVERERAERIQTELRLGNDLAAAVLRARNAEATIERLRAALLKARVAVSTWSPAPDEPLEEINAALQSTEQRT